MKCLCILGILASLATAQAATILSTTTKDDPSTLTSGGYGAYYGFSFDLDHMLVSSGSGIAQNSTACTLRFFPPPPRRTALRL